VSRTSGHSPEERMVGPHGSGQKRKKTLAAQQQLYWVRLWGPAEHLASLALWTRVRCLKLAQRRALRALGEQGRCRSKKTVVARWQLSTGGLASPALRKGVRVSGLAHPPPSPYRVQ